MPHELLSIPSREEARASEQAVLQRAAVGLKDALRAECAFAAVVEDGKLLFRGAAPEGVSLPEAICGQEYEPVQRALTSAEVVPWLEPPASLGGGTAVIVPWTTGGAVLGVGIVSEPQALPSEPELLALVGAKTGCSLAAHRDCSDLAHRLAGLQHSGSVLEELIAASSDPIKLVDLDGHICCWNDAAERLYGWSSEEAVGSMMPHIPHQHRLGAVRDMRVIAAEGDTVRRELAHLRSDGSSVRVEITAIPVMDGEGHPYGVLSIGRRARGAELHESSDHMVRAFSQGIKAPLTAIVGYSQLLSNAEILDDPQKRSRTLNMLERRAAELNVFVDDLLLLSEHSGEDDPERVDSIDIKALLADILTGFEQGSGSGRIVVDFESDMEPVRLDRRRVTRAIEHLLACVARASEGCELVVRLAEDGEQALVEISGGRLISSHLAGDPVEAFLGDVGSPGSASEAMSLLIAKRMIESEGGAVDVHAERGEVCRVTARLPHWSRERKADSDER